MRSEIFNLPRPRIDREHAGKLATEVFGIVGEAKELGSQQDRNFLITSSSSGSRFLLKVSNPVFTVEELDAQNRAMELLARAGLTVPMPTADSNGSMIATVDLNGRPHHVRLLSFVEGIPMIDFEYLSVGPVADLGRLAGGVSIALADFEHPGLERLLQWDLRRGEEVVAGLLQHVPDESRRALLAETLDTVSASLAPLTGLLPIQALHADLTDDNVVCTIDAAGRPTIAGIIDFGDISYGWRVAELAVACTAVFHHDPVRPLAILPLIEAFDAVVHLTEAEIDAIWPLIVLRGATLVVSGEHQVAIDPGNDYADTAREREWVIFETAARFDVATATAAIRCRLGRERPRPDFAPDHLLLPFLASSPPALVDLGYSSRSLRNGSWLEDPLGEEERIQRETAASSGCAVTRFGEARLTHATARSATEPINVALAVDVWLGGQAKDVVAPFSGELRELDDSLALVRESWTLVIAGLASPKLGPVSAGDMIGRAEHALTLWLVATSTAAPLRSVPPRFVAGSEFFAWSARLDDPGTVLGLHTRPDVPDPADVLARRERSYDPLQSHYYVAPPQIERGWREHLIDTNGRHYLDMVNNVSILGHGHPRIAATAADQWLMLNTNSRFNYDAVARLSECLLATVPGRYDTVLLVNSGTEAVDLALRLTRAYSGRDDVLCVGESYHGWSLGADAVSTAISDNPRAAETRPSWVHVTGTLNAYRGTYRGSDAGAAYAAESITQIERLAQEGRPIGTFIAEPRNGNAGAIEVPQGYLAAVYDAIRAGGGVCISDEVQVGYGRLGNVFWGFQEHAGIVPDVITIAKAMGNGHPLGAVITRREIADALSSQGTFFSSAGGSTLSSRIGVEVLEIMAEEGLPANALEVGTYLQLGIKQLSNQHPMIGAVHGRGLYLGVELVRNRVTLEPAREETAAICDRLLELGVIVQPTGDRQNVLKVKPPLCFTKESADFFISCLDDVLTRGW